MVWVDVSDYVLCVDFGPVSVDVEGAESGSAFKEFLEVGTERDDEFRAIALICSYFECFSLFD